MTSSSAEDAKDEVKLISVPFAQPLAGKKLLKKLLKLTKKAAKQKHLRRGVKEVVKSIRKGEKGICAIAADVSPMDVISHLPVLCEEQSIPYVFVPSKEALGVASDTKRPTCVVLVSSKGASALEEYYKPALEEAKGLQAV